MFRIDKNYVNLAVSQMRETSENTAGVAGYSGPLTPASAQEKARELVMTAEAEAARIIEDARLEAASIIEQARDEFENERARGFETGCAEGAEHARSEYEVIAAQDNEALRNVLREIYEERVNTIDELEQQVVQLATDIAGKVIGDAVAEVEGAFESLVINALRQLEIEGKLIIRVGPREYDRFFPSGSAVFVLGEGVSVTASVLKDAALSDGDCMIESEDGTASVGVETQMALIKLAFSRAEDYD